MVWQIVIFFSKSRTGKDLAHSCIILVTEMMSPLQGLATHAGLYSNQIPIKVCPCSASVHDRATWFLHSTLHPSFLRRSVEDLCLPLKQGRFLFLIVLLFFSLLCSPSFFFHPGSGCSDGLSSLWSQLHLSRPAHFPETYAEGSRSARHALFTYNSVLRFLSC